MVLRPRVTLAALVHAPAWRLPWLIILIVWACCGGWLLSTDVGQQALVDERVRVVETLGGRVTDAQYAELQAAPPWWVYLTSGSRVLLLPITTLAVATAMLWVAHWEAAGASLAQALALAVHASVPLLVGQVLATPLHFVRESLTSPLNLAAVLPLVEAGTLPARFFGTLDLFVLWWTALIALSLSALTGRPATRYAWPLVALLFVFAGIATAVIAVLGGA
jgi:hypothetical protein